MSELGDREPFSREGEIISAIRNAYAPADSIAKLNTRETTACGGVALSGRLTNRIAIREAMPHVLTMRQHMILWYRFALDKSQTATSKHYNLDRNTVAVDEVAGLQALVRVFWEEPTYISPPRIRSRQAFVDILNARLHGRAS